MKHLMFFITFVSFLFSSSILNASNDPVFENVEKTIEECTVYEKYRVTARTRNSLGSNYWVDLVVEGSVSSLGSSIYGVYYNDGYGLKSISYMIDVSYENTYYVYIDGHTYYFEF